MIQFYFVNKQFYFIVLFFLDDIFGIDEITLYEGEHSEKVYAVGGEIIDGVSKKFINT